MSAQRNKEGVCSVAFATFEGAETCLPVGSFKIILWPFFFTLGLSPSVSLGTRKTLELKYFLAFSTST